MDTKNSAVPIIPCSDLDRSQAFYEKLGFELTGNYPAFGYRILSDGAGASVHLTRADPDWLVPERNAHGVYVYSRNVDGIAGKFGQQAEGRPWGMREFAVSDPDGTLVRVGWEG